VSTCNGKHSSRRSIDEQLSRAARNCVAATFLASPCTKSIVVAGLSPPRVVGPFARRCALCDHRLGSAARGVKASSWYTTRNRFTRRLLQVLGLWTERRIPGGVLDRCIDAQRGRCLSTPDCNRLTNRHSVGIGLVATMSAPHPGLMSLSRKRSMRWTPADAIACVVKLPGEKFWPRWCSFGVMEIPPTRLTP
jgi:hypothetical protein